MPTYIYEVLESDAESAPPRFEIFQRMTDAALTHHPETGQPVRRIVTGGVGMHLGVLRRSTVVDKKSPAATACGCATGLLPDGKGHVHHHHHGHGHHHHHHGHGHHQHGHGGHVPKGKPGN